jgi:hypothetical protein
MVIGRCTGQATLGEILDGLGAPAGAVEFRNQIVSSVRRLYSLGYLVRV